MNKTIAIDFDGTLACYCKTAGRGNFGKPVPGAVIATKELRRFGFKIIINTTRAEVVEICDYLVKHGFEFDNINFSQENIDKGLSDKKIIADIYVDDRNIEFAGNWQETINKIKNFKQWEIDKTDCEGCALRGTA